MAKRQTKKAEMVEEEDPIPNIGEILRRLRSQRKLTVREMAEQSGLSYSFLRAVERGESDISLRRLGRLARVFGYDLGSFLGFTTRLTHPNFVAKGDRLLIDRGKGVRYESLRLPGIDFELEVVELAPHSAFRSALSHEGIDVVYAMSGDVVLVFNGADYPMRPGDCCVFSAGYPHKLRNDAGKKAAVLSFTTGSMH